VPQKSKRIDNETHSINMKSQSLTLLEGNLKRYQLVFSSSKKSNWTKCVFETNIRYCFSSSFFTWWPDFKQS